MPWKDYKKSTGDDVGFERVVVDRCAEVDHVELVLLWDEALDVLLDVLWSEEAAEGCGYEDKECNKSQASVWHFIWVFGYK